MPIVFPARRTRNVRRTAEQQGHPGQIRAAERKRENQRLKRARDQAEADSRGITVAELLQEKTEETQEIITDRGRQMELAHRIHSWVEENRRNNSWF